jgi:hypothetical protein
MGNMGSVIWQMFPGQPTAWNASNVPDLTGKIALVTGTSDCCRFRSVMFTLTIGGNTGTGKETVKVRIVRPFTTV